MDFNDVIVEIKRKLPENYNLSITIGHLGVRIDLFNKIKNKNIVFHDYSLFNPNDNFKTIVFDAVNQAIDEDSQEKPLEEMTKAELIKVIKKIKDELKDKEAKEK